MDIRSNILDAIGNTPIVKLNRVSHGVKGEMLAKCEFTNPGGSIKDRIGAHIVERAEQEGLIKPGGTIVEGTSGNTGMGLAIAAAVKGYKCIFVMPDKMSEEKRQNLRAFGAKVIITPTAVDAADPESYYSVSKRIAAETPNSYYVNQYDNLFNRETHYRTTGPEIWAQTEGKFDAVVIGMGTCGTITGLGMYFKEKDPSIKVIGVDPKGSILKDLFETGKMIEAKGYVLEGIGEDIVPKNLDYKYIDHIIRIEDKESFLMTRKLLTKEGIFAGMSSGAAVVGALRYMAETENPGRVLVILPDSGNRYLSKVFNDAWMIENSYMERKVEKSVGDLLKTLHKERQMISATVTDKVEDVVRKMKDSGISQLAVLAGEEVKGVISEMDLLRPLFAREVSGGDSIAKYVDQNYSIVEETDSIERLNEVFMSDKIAMVSVGGKIRHIVTQIDLISFLSMEKGSVDV